MRGYRLPIWVLLGYLVLLLSLGPSLHHADFLGLHHQVSSTQSGDTEEDSHHGPCCCHSHLHGLVTASSEKSNEQTFVEGGAEQQHRCAFCDFFDEYQIVPASQTAAPIEAPAAWDVDEIHNSVVSNSILLKARGPPVFSLVPA